MRGPYKSEMASRDEAGRASEGAGSVSEKTKRTSVAAGMASDAEGAERDRLRGR